MTLCWACVCVASVPPGYCFLRAVIYKLFVNTLPSLRLPTSTGTLRCSADFAFYSALLLFRCVNIENSERNECVLVLK